MDDREIFFLYFTTFPKPPQFKRHGIDLGHNGNAAGFTVQAIDQMWTRSVAKIKAHASDETGHRPILARMTNQSGRFVDCQQFRVFQDDLQLTSPQKHRRLYGSRQWI